jgi:hypothetical protein
MGATLQCGGDCMVSVLSVQLMILSPTQRWSELKLCVTDPQLTKHTVSISIASGDLKVGIISNAFRGLRKV